MHAWLDDSDDHLRWIAPTDLNLDYMGITHLDCVTLVNYEYPSNCMKAFSSFAVNVPIRHLINFFDKLKRICQFILNYSLIASVFHPDGLISYKVSTCFTAISFTQARRRGCPASKWKLVVTKGTSTWWICVSKLS